MATPGQAATTVCYLTRHCDVANPGGVLYGHLPNFGLSPKGREQGANLGRYFAPRGIQAIYTSPLQRAQETAGLIGANLGPGPAPPTVSRPELIEAEFGRYLQGTKYRDVLWKKPRWWLHMLWPGIVPGDESMRAMAARVFAVISEGLREHSGGAFVCISHGDPIQAFWAQSEGRMPWALHRLQCAKGGLLRLEYRDGSLAHKTYLSPEDVARQVGSPEGPVTELVADQS